MIKSVCITIILLCAIIPFIRMPRAMPVEEWWRGTSPHTGVQQGPASSTRGGSSVQSMGADFSFEDTLKECFSCQKIQIIPSPFRHYRAFDTDNVLLGVGFLSSDIMADNAGFKGPILFFVCMDPRGNITGVFVVDHQETPEYAELAFSSELLEQFKRKNVSDPFTIGSDIHAVTGATISSASLIQAVKETGSKAYESLFERRPAALSQSAPRVQRTTLPFWQDIALFLALCGSALRVRRRAYKGRLLYLMIMTVVIGFTLRNFISIYHIQSWGQFARSLSLQPYFYGLMLVFFAATIILGRIYCGWVCPFGGIMYAIYTFSPVKGRLPESLHRKLLVLKYIVLVIAAVFVSTRGSMYAFEPFEYVFTFHWKTIFFGISIGYIVVAFVIPYFWCRYLCFLGAVWGILSVIPFVRYTVPCKQEGCRLCASHCPTGAILENGKIVQRECIRCNECQDCKFENRKSLT